jgi:KDO2-lipid IV(A) lauroyltransferase
VAQSARYRLKRAINTAIGWLAIRLLKVAQRVELERLSRWLAASMRRLGPWLPEHRVGRANLAAAFPDMPAEQRDRILMDVWGNLGLIAAEFVHLDRLWDYDVSSPNTGRIEIPPEHVERFVQMRDDGKPALIFAAHLANWEIPALVAPAHGLDSAVLYRTPNIGDVAEAVRVIRARHMGTLIPGGRDAAVRLAGALERGMHVGMLVDQHFAKGVQVEFFGRKCWANPMIARLARHFDCPIHGTRAIRLPDHRFRLELTEAIAPIRDQGGQIDVQATMQVITWVVEGWVREHPEQWLWLHRRWR